MTGKKVSIKRIAELSNVSTATVSRVINNNGRFSEETRKRVMSVIEENGYHINAIAKTLRLQKSNTIGMIVPDISNEFFSSIINLIERNFFERGISTIICNTDKDPAKENAYLQSLDLKMVDGLICISGQEKIDESQISRNIPIVYIDRIPEVSNNVAIVGSNHLEGGYLATKHLIDKGCKRIMLLTKEKNNSSVIDRIAGYQKALMEASLELDANLFVYTPLVDEHSYELARKAIQKALVAGLSFDGIFATNDWLAYGAIRELESQGISVPGEVKVVGFDDDTISKYSSPSITTIHQDVATIANEASDILYRLMSKPNTKIKKRHIQIPVELIERETT